MKTTALMTPYERLGVTPAASDEEIRARYGELIRLHPPERNPQQFAEIRAAYDRIRDIPARAEYALFRQGEESTPEGMIKELEARTTTQRYSITKMLEAHEGNR